MGIYSQSSSELLEDADVPTFSEDLQSAFVRVIRHKMDSDFLSGDGSGKAQGIINAAASVQVTAASAGGIEYADARKMLARLWPGSYANAVWIAHPSVIEDLVAMTVSGTADSGWVQVGNQAGRLTLLARPILISEKIPSLGNDDCLLLADFSQYGIGIKREIRLISTNAVDFANDRTSWLATVRVDGQSLWDEPLTPMNGSDTLSPFVRINYS